VLFARDGLVAEQQDVVVEEGAVDLTELLLAHRPRHIHVQHFGAEGIGQLAQSDRHRISNEAGVKAKVSLSAIRHPPSAIRHPPSAIRHPPSLDTGPDEVVILRPDGSTDEK
jgi:hypothetical protein